MRDEHRHDSDGRINIVVTAHVHFHGAADESAVATVTAKAHALVQKLTAMVAALSGAAAKHTPTAGD